MILQPIRASLRAGTIIATALVLCAASNLSTVLSTAQAQAAPSLDRANIEEVLNGLDRGRSIGQVAISPDGKRLAWIQQAKEGTEIRVAALVYARSSVIDFIRAVHTPTLLVVGDRDGECPAPQSFEFWHALRELHVPTRLVVYPNEGHGFVGPAHRRDVMERAAEWFARYMPPAP